MPSGSVGAWTGAGFPIPMRGNEGPLPGRVRFPLPRFPIPMRGNELGVVEIMERRQAGFPIPMRGNEMARKSDVRLFAREVPNPHEG